VLSQNKDLKLELKRHICRVVGGV